METKILFLNCLDFRKIDEFGKLVTFAAHFCGFRRLANVSCNLGHSSENLFQRKKVQRKVGNSKSVG